MAERAPALAIAGGGASVQEIPTAWTRSIAAIASGSPSITAEYDALPGVGHGCGHSVIAASSVGAFLALTPLLASGDLPGGVTLLGTPAEEGGGGKELLIQAGAFDGYDASVMVHPGVLLEGGTRPNIVPERAVLEYFLRSRAIASILELSERIENAFRGAALTAGVEVDVAWDAEPIDLPYRLNRTLAERFVAHSVPRRDVVVAIADTGQPVGSTDVGNAPPPGQSSMQRASRCGLGTWCPWLRGPTSRPKSAHRTTSRSSARTARGGDHPRRRRS